MIREFIIKLNLPSWARWYAVDQDGTVCVYQCKPRVGIDCWWPWEGHHLDILVLDTSLIPDFGWTKTLHEIKR